MNEVFGGEVSHALRNLDAEVQQTGFTNVLEHKMRQNLIRKLFCVGFVLCFRAATNV